MADHLRVAISGATGLIGSALRERLAAAGHDVVAMVRRRPDADDGDVYYSGAVNEIDDEALARCDAVVHLAGAPIGERWTEEHKQRILRSRVDTTSLIAGTIADLADGPRVLVQGSAVGYYGSRGDQVLPETAARGDGFLADVTVAWEAAAAPADAAADVRVAYARTGVVLAEHGPLVEKVELPFKLGVGGVIGDGEQWVPWIGLEDEVRALEFLLTHDVHGPANLCAPEPVTNRTLTKAIGDVLDRPTILPTPVFAIRALYGEMGVTLATASQRCIPTTLEEAGFEWHQTDVHEPLREAFA